MCKVGQYLVVPDQPVMAGLADPLPRVAPQEATIQTLEDTKEMMVKLRKKKVWILMIAKMIPLRGHHVGLVWRE